MTKSKHKFDEVSTADICYLLGRTRSWFNDNKHRFEGRNGNGSYNLRELLASIDKDFRPADLSNFHRERALQVAERFFIDGSDPDECLPAIVNAIESIEQRGGAPAMAAFAEIILQCGRQIINDNGIDAWDPEINVAAIRKRALDQAEREITREAEKRPYRDLMTVHKCFSCDRYRWGDDWCKAPVPSGYAECEDIQCPECTRKDGMSASA